LSTTERDGRAERVVLVVEDEEPNRALLRAILGRASHDRLRGIVLVEAGDLATARAVLADRRIDLVLLDVRLPDGNGLSLIPAESERTESTPSFVVLSASVLPTERAGALAAGASDFLAKPYRPSDLVDAVLEQLPAAS
jgi:two-component system, OmpR family, KDP operon response regulator KdpE